MVILRDLIGELDWHMVDDEFNEYAKDMLNFADILLFGRSPMN